MLASSAVHGLVMVLVMDGMREKRFCDTAWLL